MIALHDIFGQTADARTLDDGAEREDISHAFKGRLDLIAEAVQRRIKDDPCAALRLSLLTLSIAFSLLVMQNMEPRR